MPATRYISFPPYQLDIAEGQLRRGDEVIALRPKPFALLCYLAQHPGRLVTKETLLDVIRPDSVVSEGVLSVDIAELRKALGDNARKPRFIETAHGRGYRFVSPVAESREETPLGIAQQKTHAKQSERFVGRNSELDQLGRLLDCSLAGQQQIVFLSGEPGIGKTTLVEAFLRTVSRGNRFWIGRGQCIAHYGSGEGYLPLLEAVGRLCREPGGEHLIQILRQQAPAWLAQLPALVPAAERQQLQAEVQGVTRDRMLREMFDALDAISSERPLILRLEDLHWSDVSTLDLLAFMARRTEPARLLVIGTYRPIEIMERNHPLRAIKLEMLPNGYCEEIALDYLTEEAVSEYLARRFDSEDLASILARTVHERTDGNPLFMVNVTDDLVAQGVVSDTDGNWDLKIPPSEIRIATPKTIEQMIIALLERLDSGERRLLEVASVVGDEFSAEAVSAGLQKKTEEVEAKSDELVRRERFIRLKGTDEWPDGTITTVYGFIHALYREVLYDQLPVNRRIRLHREIAERAERGYGDCADEIAAELAVHFEYGRAIEQAIRYRRYAGANAAQRSANIEAIEHLTKGISLMQTIDDSGKWADEELDMRIMLGAPLIHTKGYAAPEIEENYARARALWPDGGEATQLHAILWGLWLYYVVGAQHDKALDLGRELMQLAEREENAALLTTAHYALECTLFYMGQASSAYAHAEQGIAHYDANQHRELAFSYAQDPGVICRSVGSWALWVQGFPQRALRLSDEAVAHAHDLAYPFSLAFALNFSSALHQMCGENGPALDHAEAAIALCTEHGFPFWLEMGNVLRGRILVEQGGEDEAVDRMADGLNAYRATDAELFCPHFLCLLAEGYGFTRRIEKGFAAIREAYTGISRSAETYFEPEVHRVEGELILGTRTSNRDTIIEDRAMSCFQKAIEISQQQGAKSWELRAATSLARLWQQQDKQAEAHRLLSEIYDLFTEGFDTKDLREAKALLEALG
jgi:DNA-binding winged helix-turn-helix (wHTH) protein/predicted ATPase